MKRYCFNLTFPNGDPEGENMWVDANSVEEARAHFKSEYPRATNIICIGSR